MTSAAPWHRRLAALLGSWPLVVTVGCGTADRAPPAGADVTFQVLDETASSGYPARTPGVVLVGDTAGWQQLWAQHQATRSPMPPLPAVDFASSVVVAVFAGEGSGGLKVTRITRVGATITISAERADTEGCTGLPIIEHSAEIVRIPGPGGPASLDLRTAGRRCN